MRVWYPLTPKKARKARHGDIGLLRLDWSMLCLQAKVSYSRSLLFVRMFMLCYTQALTKKRPKNHGPVMTVEIDLNLRQLET